MRRRKVDSIEVQQMKAQAKEEKARKKVSGCTLGIPEQNTILWKRLLVLTCGVPGFPLDGASDISSGKTNEGGSGTSEGRDGATTFSTSR